MQQLKSTINLALSVFIVAFLLIKAQTSTQEINRRLEKVQAEMNSIKNRTADRWTATDHLLWQSELKRLNPNIVVPQASQIREKVETIRERVERIKAEEMANEAMKEYER